MHPALVRLPAVVALAAALASYPALTAYPASAMAAPPRDIAVQQAAAVEDHTQHGAGSGTEADVQPDDVATPPADDMEGMEGMEGMDHGGAEPESDEGSTGGHGEGTGGHGDEAAPSGARPVVPVLSAFVGLNAAVLITAAVLRRRDRDRPRRGPRPAATPTPA